MAETYRVIISPHALGELERILDYIAIDSPANAIRVIDGLLEEIQSLEQFPGRYAKWEASTPVEDETVPVRLMPSPPFRVLYQVLDAHRTVRVVTIEHGAR